MDATYDRFLRRTRVNRKLEKRILWQFTSMKVGLVYNIRTYRGGKVKEGELYGRNWKTDWNV